MARSRSKTDNVSVNIQPVIDFFKNNKKLASTAVVVALVLISIFFSIYFRSYPSTLPVAEDWAYNGLTNNVKNQISQQVNQQYPNLPSNRKNALIDEQFQKVIAQQGPALKLQAEQQADLIRKEMQNDDGQTYLLAIDPYYYWRHTKNVLDHGYGADKKVGNDLVNDHMMAPLGRVENRTEFHEVYSAIIYKIVKIFNPDAKLFNVFFWMPVLISALAVIPAFFITRKKAGNLGGFFAGMIVAVHTTFIGRTTAGFSDTDAYNVMFPLFIFWVFLEAFEAKDLKRKMIYSGLTGLLMGLYSRTWGGWWYIFDFALAVIIGYLAFSIVRMLLNKKDKNHKKETVNALTTIAGILVSSGIFVSLLIGFDRFIKAPLSAIGFTTIQNAAKVDLWPNVFTTVAELNKASLSSIVGQIGGQIYFYLACLGVAITMVSYHKLKKTDWTILIGSIFVFMILITKPLLSGNPIVYLAIMMVPLVGGLIILLKDKRDIDVKYSIFLTVWFVGTIYASTQGVRFILLLVPAYAVAFGIFIGQVYKMITKWSEKQFEFDQRWLKVMLVIVALLLLVKPITSADTAAKYEVPSMNDDWWASLDKINQESAPDAIINSWWDFGHWFKSIGDRAVTFDGASQNTPMAHWIGKVLSTSNEDEAIGILRMLDCGSRKGFDTLARRLQGDRTDDAAITPETTLKTKDLIDSIILLDKEDAKKTLLEEGLDDGEAEEVLELTHCQPPEDYFITSEDMTGKAGVWGHFGNWDFRKAYVYNVLIKQPQQEAIPKIQELFGLEKKEAGEMYFEALSLPDENKANAWISPWPNYLTTRVSRCQNNSEVVICPINRNAGSQQGRILRLEQALINLSALNETKIQIGAYNQQTGQREGTSMVSPNSVILADEGYRQVKIENAGYAFDIVLDKNANKYQMIIAEPELSDGMYTRLFFLEGKGTEHFEKFSDRTSPITGQRIIVWKVRWD